MAIGLVWLKAGIQIKIVRFTVVPWMTEHMVVEKVQPLGYRKVADVKDSHLHAFVWKSEC